MTSRRFLYSGLFAAIFAGALAVKMPLALAVDLAGIPLAAEKIEGTIWNGRIEGAAYDAYPLGRVDVSARALPLLLGRLSAHIDVDGPFLRGGSDIALRGELITFAKAELKADMAPLALDDAFGQPMDGFVRVATDALVLAPDGCRRGRLHLETDTLERSAKRYGGKGFSLAGEGQCEPEGGRFVLPLTGSGEEGEISVEIAVSPRGYETRTVIAPTDQKLASALAAYGFQRQGDQYSLVQRGEVF